MSSAIFLNQDLRYRHLAKYLETNQIKTTLGTDSLSDYDFVFAPIPLTKDQITVNQTNLSLHQLVSSLKQGQKFFSCNIPSFFRNDLERKNITYVDFKDHFTFQAKNAIATAEGAIAWAINHSSQNLSNHNILILGYGCCGKQLAMQLNGFHSNITIAGRRLETKTLAHCAGYQYLDITASKINLSVYDYIFNTIPAPLLTKEVLETCSPDCVIVDIASAPGGLDYDYVKKQNLNAHLYLGIPGKIAPKESAKLLYEIIEPYLL